MKIVDAYWEKRNLGVDCTEMTITSEDEKSDIINQINNLKKGYIVIKIPYSLTDHSLLVQKYGFDYIESLVTMGRKLVNPPQLPDIFSRYKPYIGVHPADDSEIASLLKDIESGDIFLNDRIAKDPYFSKKISGIRYSGWIRDLQKMNCRINIGTYKDDNVVFGVLTNNGEKYDAVMGGLLAASRNSRLGFIALYINTMSAYLSGGNYIETRVSTNNLSILKLHQIFGYSIKDFYNVFIKHI